MPIRLRLPPHSGQPHAVAPVGRAVPSPPFRGILSIPAGGIISPFSVGLSFIVALANLPHRRGRDTAPRLGSIVGSGQAGGNELTHQPIVGPACSFGLDRFHDLAHVGFGGGADFDNGGLHNRFHFCR